MSLARAISPVNLDAEVAVRGPLAESEMQVGAALTRMAAATIDLRDQLPSVAEVNCGESANRW